MCMCSCLREYMSIWWCPQRPGKGIQPQGTRVTGDCEPPKEGAGILSITVNRCEFDFQD